MKIYVWPALDAVACKASHLTNKRLRLSHVRRLARSVVSLAPPPHHHIHSLAEADDANKTSGKFSFDNVNCVEFAS